VLLFFCNAEVSKVQAWNKIGSSRELPVEKGCAIINRV